MADETRRFYGVQFHPEVAHTAQGAAILRALRRSASAARTGDWMMRDHIDEAVDAHPRAGRRRRGGLRPVGRRRLDRGGDADPPRHRRPADLHLRRQRPAAPRRGRAGHGDVREPAARPRHLRRRQRPVPRPARRRQSTPSRSARSSARRSSTCSRREARKAGSARVRLPGAGHALSRRDRVGVGARPRPYDQEPPQRRRPARADAASSWSSRCAICSRTKCAQRRPGPRPRPRVRRPPAVPGPGPGGAHPRRDHAANGSTCCAAPTRSSPRKSAARRLVRADDLAELRRAAAGAERRRDGRRAAPTSTPSRSARSRASTA